VLAAQARGATAPVTAADLTLLRRAAGVLESRQIASAAIEAHLAAGRAAISSAGRPRRWCISTPRGRWPGPRRCCPGSTAGSPRRWPRASAGTTPGSSGTAGPGSPTWPGTGRRSSRQSCGPSPPATAPSSAGSRCPWPSAPARPPGCSSGWSSPAPLPWSRSTPSRWTTRTTTWPRSAPRTRSSTAAGRRRQRAARPCWPGSVTWSTGPVGPPGPSTAPHRRRPTRFPGRCCGRRWANGSWSSTAGWTGCCSPRS
jgi:hypothetical protein